MIILILLPTTLIVLGLIVLWIMSPGKPEPIVNTDGNSHKRISEKCFVEIGGIRQGMFIRSADTNLPVLLFVHGGPAFPNYFLFERFNPGLEKFFTVCYWEQRGGGLSYSKDINPESMTLEQLKADAIEVTNYLRKRFNREKIYIMAWSGGTTIALPAVADHPEYYHAYIAMAQMTNQQLSERMAFQYMVQRLTELKNERAIRQLKKFNNLDTEEDLIRFCNSGIRDQLMHRLGIGTMHHMKSIFTGIFLPVWTCKAYTLPEKINLWKSKLLFFPKTSIRKQTLLINFPEKYPELKVPVIFVCGQYDLTVSKELTVCYFQQLIAPRKSLYIFEDAAHGPLFEQPEKFRRMLIEEVVNMKADAIF